MLNTALEFSMIVQFFMIIPIFYVSVDGMAVMSIDLGSEWMKIAIVSPGVPMDIVLNAESKRKTPMAVALKDDERVFGASAINMGVRYPKNCYFFLLDLLGKSFDHPIVHQYLADFPYYQLKAHPDTGTVLFVHDDTTVYSPQELIGMILSHAKSMAEAYANQKIKDSVLVIPPYFNQAERKAVLEAAEIGGLSVLQLISEPMSVALNYGMFRRKDINETVRKIMYFDMGARSTVASIVAFQVVKTKEKGFTETFPQAAILGIGYDRLLGGLNIQLKLRNYLAEEFNKVGRASKDVWESPRAISKLFKEAGRVKNILSANNIISASVENVMEDIDFTLPISRQELYDMNKDFFDRVTEPMDRALIMAGINIEEIDELILIGAGTRIPKVMELLQAYTKAELSKSMNTDESAAMGAIYKAADLSMGFKVKKFVTRECVILPITVDFERFYEEEDGMERKQTSKLVRRSLYPVANGFPQKKIMTFNKHIDDFSFFVNLDNLEHLPKAEISNIGSLNLSGVSVKGLGDSIKANLRDGFEFKGVKAHFNLDESGLLRLSLVESVFERNISVEEQEAKAKNISESEKKEDSSWSKFGESISGFFSGGEDKRVDDDSKLKEKEEGKDDAADKNKTDNDANEKKNSTFKDGKQKKKNNFKPKIENKKHSLEFSIFSINNISMDLTPEMMNASKSLLQNLMEKDLIKLERESTLNELESCINQARERIYDDVNYIAASTAEEKENITANCDLLSEWIDEMSGPQTEINVLRSKLDECHRATELVYARVKEQTERPEVMAALWGLVNSSQTFFDKVVASPNAVGPEGYFTQVEIDKLAEMIVELSQWANETTEAISAQPLTEMAVVSNQQIATKCLPLQREVQYMYNKARIAKAEKEKERIQKETEARIAKEAAAAKAKSKKKKDGGNTAAKTSEEKAEDSSSSGSVMDKETKENSEFEKDKSVEGDDASSSDSLDEGADGKSKFEKEKKIVKDVPNVDGEESSPKIELKTDAVQQDEAKIEL